MEVTRKGGHRGWECSGAKLTLNKVRATKTSQVIEALRAAEAAEATRPSAIAAFDSLVGGKTIGQLAAAAAPCQHAGRTDRDNLCGHCGAQLH